MNRTGLVVTILSASFLFPLVGCGSRQDSAMSTSSTTANAAPLKTVCVGRYTLDIPRASVIIRA
jgi:hypothetical protein